MKTCYVILSLFLLNCVSFNIQAQSDKKVNIEKIKVKPTAKKSPNSSGTIGTTYHESAPKKLTFKQRRAKRKAERAARREAKAEQKRLNSSMTKKHKNSKTKVAGALQFNQKDFLKSISKSNKLIVADFSADWCMPCQLMEPHIEDLAVKYQKNAIVGTIDFDANPELATQFEVFQLPTVLYIKNGKVVDRQVGGTSRSTLERKLVNNL